MGNQRQVARVFAPADDVGRTGALRAAAAIDPLRLGLFAKHSLSWTIARRSTLFSGRRFEPGEEEFRAHEALYARARILGIYRS